MYINNIITISACRLRTSSLASMCEQCPCVVYCAKKTQATIGPTGITIVLDLEQLKDRPTSHCRSVAVKTSAVKERSQVKIKHALKHTRKLCYRKDDRTMRPIGLHGCPENFRVSLTTPTALFPTFFMGFCSDRLYECSYKI